MNNSPSNSQILEELRQMDWDEFEELVAEHWEEDGWDTQVTSGSQDRGIDIEATKHNPAKSRLLIQAKRHQQGNKVSAPKIREYAGLYQQENNVDTVYVVTTSSFTQQAKEIADDTQVKLINGQKLARKLSDQLIREWLSDSEYGGTPEYIVTPGYIGWTGIILGCFCLIGGSLWVMGSINFIPVYVFVFSLVFFFLMFTLLLFLEVIKRVALTVITNVLPSRGTE
jgi:hypothetical protein